MAAPYIMPDGPGGRPYRLTEHSGGKAGGKGKGSGGARGKDEAWSALQQARAAAAAAANGGAPEDLAELRAIARAGWRRRNRWFNDKALRDGHRARFGAMTAEDMQAQFNPPPFGIPAPPSAFAQVASTPEAAALWEHFRSISMDKQQKVLDRWEQHNRAGGGSGAGGGASSSGQQGDAPPGGPPDAAQAAIAAWARVGRAARAALKKANPHSVMELEHEVLGLLEGGDASAELLMDVPDGFGRLLVHGLCEFHGLLSATRPAGGRVLVAVHFKRPVAAGAAGRQQQQQQQEGAQAEQQQAAADGGSSSTGGGGGGAEAGAAAAAAAAAGEVPAPPEITCTDVLLALREAGAQGGFDAAVLGRYVRRMHEGSDALSDDYVLVGP